MKNLQIFAIFLLIATLPFSIPLNSVAIMFMTLVWLIYIIKKAKKIEVRKKNLLFYSLLFSGMLLLSFALSGNKQEGVFHLEQYISFFLFPLIFSTGVLFEEQDKKYLLFFFAIVVSIALSICLFRALSAYWQDHNLTHFFYHNLGKKIGIHAGYLSLYLIFALIILGAELLKSKQFKSRLGYFVWFIYLFMGLILLSSKMLIFSFILCINISFIIYIFQKKQKKLLLGVVLFNLLMVVSIFYVPFLQKRFVKLLNLNTQYWSDTSLYSQRRLGGTAIRLIKWKLVLEVLDENNAWILGNTIGDGMDRLRQKSKDYNMYEGIPDTGWHNYIEYNAHNQYFQFLLELGIIGLVYFLLYLIIAFRIAFQFRLYIFLAILFVFTIFCISESVLSSQKGIVFFAFLSNFFLFQLADKEKKQQTSTSNHI